MGKTRVGIFSWDFEPPEGGIGIHVSALYHALLQDNEFEPVVFSPRRTVLKNHVTLRSNNPIGMGQIFFSLSCSLNLEKLVRKYNLDVVHFMGSSGGVQLLKKPSVPAVFTLNNTYFFLQRCFPRFKFAVMKKMEQQSLKNADRITAISNGIAKEIQREEQKDIHLVYIGIDDKVFLPLPVKREKIILYSGRLKENKGVLDLLDAFALLPENGFELWFVGEGPLLGELKQKAINLDVVKRVRFFPKTDQQTLADFYSKAFVTVLPSWSEGFGLVLAEAMKCGSIVAGSDIPGIRDQIEPGKTGFVFQPKDPKSISDCLSKIIASDSLETIRQNAFGKAEAFSTSSMVSAYKDIYRELLQHEQGG